MRLLIAVLFFGLLNVSAQAQDVNELAEKYINLPPVQEMIDTMFSPETMATSIKSQMPPGIELSDEQAQKIGVLMAGAMQELRPKLQEVMLTSSAETFTAEEFQALIDFYSSENGASVMKKMPVYFQGAMGSLGPEIQGKMAGLLPEITKIMQEK